jgi:hypothetical protein
LENSNDSVTGEFESVEFETGWFVIRQRESKGENGQWLAIQTPADVEQ